MKTTKTTKPTIPDRPELARLAAEAGVDPRTMRRALAGLRVVGTGGERARAVARSYMDGTCDSVTE